jgi:signal transduction histidine kinase
MDRFLKRTRHNVISPLSILLVYGVITLLASVLIVTLLCRSYGVGASFKSQANIDGVYIDNITEYGSVAESTLKVGDNILAIETPSGLQLNFKSIDTVIDPGLLPSYSEYHEFFERQATLEKIQASGNVIFVLANGERVTVQLSSDRPLTSLPWTLWYQIICATIAILASAIVSAFQRSNNAAFYYGFTGMGIALVIYTNGYFSSRELSLPSHTFYILSKLNWFGVCLLGWGLIGTLWYYPRRLAKFPLGPAMSVFFVFFLLWDWFEIPQSLELGQRIPLYLGFFAAAILAWMQWRRQSKDPVSRAAMRWFFLSWFSGTGAFILLVLIPITFNTHWGIDYVTATGLLPLLQIGIALGILRYRLFDLDRWAMRIWLWFLGGALVILMDAILVYLLNITGAVSLSLSLISIGWLYFPLRQLLWQRLGWNPLKTDFQTAFPSILQSALSVDAEISMGRHWLSLLQSLYQPLSITELPESPESIQRTEHGLSLLIPAFPGAPPLKLSGANRGGRLMGPEDERFVGSLWQLHNAAQDFRQAFESGVAKERERVARDLHDDIASDLLGLIYSAPDAESRQRAQNAFQELRVIIQGMENASMPLLSNVAQWQVDTEERCRSVNISLAWRQAEDIDVHLPSRRIVNLRGAFREAVSNVIKHSQATQLSIEILRIKSQPSDLMTVTFKDNGIGMDVDLLNGRGIKNISNRLQELGGSAVWSTLNAKASFHPGTRLVLAVPLGTERDQTAKAGSIGGTSNGATYD